jgi:hypothetical protein
VITVDDTRDGNSSEVTTSQVAAPVPDLNARALGAALEVAIFVALALAVYLIEYFVAGPVTAFGPSNFWIAFVLLAG